MRQCWSAVALCTVISLCGVSMASIKPAIPLNEMDPIDACLFGCHMCFEKKIQIFSLLAKITANNPLQTGYHAHMASLYQDYLLTCANEVCLTDLARGVPLSRFWVRTCPGLQPIFKRM